LVLQGSARAARHLIHHLDSLLETVVGVAGLIEWGLIVVPNEHPASMVDDPLRKGRGVSTVDSWYGSDLIGTKTDTS